MRNPWRDGKCTDDPAEMSTVGPADYRDAGNKNHKGTNLPGALSHIQQPVDWSRGSEWLNNPKAESMHVVKDMPGAGGMGKKKHDGGDGLS